MLIDVKYKEGDIVKFKYRQSITTTCTCSFCGATGMIKGMDGTQEECPRCDGTGIQQMSSSQDVINDGTIQKIGIKWDRHSDPKVFYIMSGWNWSTTEISQDRVIEKVGEWIDQRRTIHTIGSKDFETKLP